MSDIESGELWSITRPKINKAVKWASAPVGEVVESGLYSALHYANAASTSSGAAAGSASLASTKAGEASASATAASTSAINAANSATAAAASAASIQGSGIAAATSATVTNLNTLTNGGFYYAASSATGAPSNTENWVVQMIPADATTRSVQVAFGLTSGIVYRRIEAGGAWPSAWVTDGTPPGAVMHFAMNSPPAGWLKANGAAVSRSTYPALFAAIGTTFGAGDGSTTFGLPDLRGEFMRGWDDGRNVDSGRVFGSAQLDQMQRLVASFISDQAANSPVFSGTATGAFQVGNTVSNLRQGSDVVTGNRELSLDSSLSPNARVSSTTSGETRARNVALLACIKH